MRYIDLSRLERLHDWPPSNINRSYPSGQPRTAIEWKRDLLAAEAALRTPPPGKNRSWVIDKYSYLWSDIKGYYRDLSDGKCWYCETKTDLGEIDHYRPKNKVFENKSHPGYWWLAFEWRNWRYCCDRCNKILKDSVTKIRSGKGTQFPLIDGEKYRAPDENTYSRYEDLLDEDPLLLDPTRPGDHFYLTFTRDGLPQPTTNDENTWEFRRATKSIRLYHLDHPALQERRKDIYFKVRDRVKDIQHYWAKWKQQHDSSARDCHGRAIEELYCMIAGDAEYSSAARAYLKEYRSNSPDWAWVDQLLTAPIPTTQPR